MTSRANPAHARWYAALGDRLHDVEHFRGRAHGRPANAAVVILKDGGVTVGKATLHTSDEGHYSRRKGYSIAVGRALKAAARGPLVFPSGIRSADGVLLEGVALRDWARTLLAIVVPDFRPTAARSTVVRSAPEGPAHEPAP